MDLVLLLKLAHVVAAIVAVGANLTYAFWLRLAGRDRDRLVWTIGGIRRLDNLVATPAYVVLLVTGVLMILGGHFSFQTSWIAVSIVLYFGVAIIGIAAFAPALRRQLAEAERGPDSQAYRDAERRSNVLGVVTVAIALIIVTLMVTMPSLW